MSDPAGDPLADAVAAAVRESAAQQHAFDNPPPGHVHGPECNPVWEARLVTDGEPVLILAVVTDPDSPTLVGPGGAGGHRMQIESRVPAADIPGVLRACADTYEQRHRAGLS